LFIFDHVHKNIAARVCSKSQVLTVHFSKCHQIYGERRGQITVRSLRSKTSPSPGVMEGGGKDTIEQTGGIPPVKSMHPAAPTAQPPSVQRSMPFSPNDAPPSPPPAHQDCPPHSLKKAKLASSPSVSALPPEQQDLAPAALLTATVFKCPFDPFTGIEGLSYQDDASFGRVPFSWYSQMMPPATSDCGAASVAGVRVGAIGGLAASPASTPATKKRGRGTDKKLFMCTMQAHLESQLQVLLASTVQIAVSAFASDSDAVSAVVTASDQHVLDRIVARDTLRGYLVTQHTFLCRTAERTMNLQIDAATSSVKAISTRTLDSAKRAWGDSTRAAKKDSDTALAHAKIASDTTLAHVKIASDTALTDAKIASDTALTDAKIASDTALTDAETVADAALADAKTVADAALSEALSSVKRAMTESIAEAKRVSDAMVASVTTAGEENARRMDILMVDTLQAANDNLVRVNAVHAAQVVQMQTEEQERMQEAATQHAAAMVVATTTNLAPRTPECVVCLEPDPSHAVLPCGHLSLCATCAADFREMPDAVRRCWVCRVSATAPFTTRIYLQ
jgi:hypothetical protein